MIRFARWLLAMLLPPDARQAVLTELDAEYARDVRPSRGRLSAAALVLAADRRIDRARAADAGAAGGAARI